jgi:hypothetical protein
MKTKLTDEAKYICGINYITTDEKLNEVVKDIKVTMRLEHGIKAKESNKMSHSEVLLWQVEENRKNPITGQ